MRHPAGVLPAIAAEVVWIVVGAGARAAGLPFYLAWLLGGTIATLALYGYDKWQARRGGRRVPERLLLALALLGGVFGAWAGMLLFRHKTRHSVFYLVNGVATVLHVVLAIWLLRR
jgi:uncharacterized membrane protein YsdA (DUF1294 family)